MDVAGLGGATLFSNGQFGSARNFVSKGDIVPFSNPFKYSLARMGGSNTKFLNASSRSPLAEHSLFGLTYFEAMEEMGREFARGHL